MSLAVESVWALARAAVIASLALLAGFPIRAFLTGTGRRLRLPAWLLLLVPYITPVLLTGYAYSNFSLSLVRYPFYNELFYNILILMKLIPVAALVLYFYPRSLSPESVCCYRLLQDGRGRIKSAFSVFAFRLRGWSAAAGVSFAVVFLLAFGEFEMASLLGVKTWTVKLFDSQAGGLLLGKSLGLALLPVLCEGAVLAAVMIILLRSRSRVGVSARQPVSLRRGKFLLVCIYLFAAVAVVSLVPFLIVLRETAAGLAVLAQNFVLAKEVAISILFSAGAAALAYAAAGWFSRRASADKKKRRLLLPAFCLCVPALLGMLLLSLVLLAVFRAPGLRAVYDTPVPLLVALGLLVLPFAILLRILLQMSRPAQALHLAGLAGESSLPFTRLRAGRVIWEMKSRGQFWVVFLLFCWAYFDMTASSILAPSGMTPVSVRLYNLMHYGQSAVLSAMVFVVFLVPFALLLPAAGVREIYLHSGGYGRRSLETQQHLPGERPTPPA